MCSGTALPVFSEEEKATSAINKPPNRQLLRLKSVVGFAFLNTQCLRNKLSELEEFLTESVNIQMTCSYN